MNSNNPNHPSYWYKKYGSYGKFLLSTDEEIEFGKNPTGDFVDIMIGFVQFRNKKNKHHRIDGPSLLVTSPNRNIQISWNINGHQISCKSSTGIWSGILYDWCIENDIDLDNLSNDDLNLIKLVWSSYGNS